MRRSLLPSLACLLCPGTVEYDDLSVLDVRLGTRISCAGVERTQYGPPVGEPAGGE